MMGRANEDEITFRVVLRFRVGRCVVDLIGTAGIAIATDAAATAAGFQNILHRRGWNLGPADLLKYELGLLGTIVLCQSFPAEGTQRADSMAVAANLGDEVGVEAQAQQGFLSAGVHEIEV